MRHASRHNTAKYSALVRHEFCWAVESITCMSPHALPCAADAVVVYETLPLEDEQVSRIGMSRPHPSLERLENELSNRIRPRPSLERLENDLSKSFEN